MISSVRCQEKLLAKTNNSSGVDRFKEEKYKMKEGLFIQLISKNQKEYGVKNNIIRKKVHKTRHGKYYVDDFIAMKIWIALEVNTDKVKKIKRDIQERNRMANEPI